MKGAFHSEKVNHNINLILDCKGDAEPKMFENTLDQFFGINRTNHIQVNFEGIINGHKVNATFNGAREMHIKPTN